MIPWFVVNIIDAIAGLFGRDTYVTAVHGGRSVQRIHLMPRIPGQPRPRRLAPYQGGPLTSGDTLPAAARGTSRLVSLDEVDAYHHRAAQGATP